MSPLTLTRSLSLSLYPGAHTSASKPLRPLSLRLFMKPTRLIGAGTLALALISPLGAASLLPAESITLDSLETFQKPGKNWVLGSSLGGDPRHTKELEPVPGTGILINVAPKKSGDSLISKWEHGDIELSFDYLVPQESNSGVYLMGRYEIQILDSWGVETPDVHDNGAIYERWIEKEKKGYEGTPPAVNASRAPGLWQNFRIVFKAPRFDKKGKKIANARFVEVEHNGFIIHRDVELTGPTRGAKWPKEAATGPILIQGDHGPVAFRNFTKRLVDFDTKISVENLTVSVAPHTEDGQKSEETDFPFEPVTHIDPKSLSEPNKFTATYRGEIHVPNTGTYAFDAAAGGGLKLAINDIPVLIPINPGVRSVPIELEAGAHAFELEYSHGRWGKPSLALFAEGPEIARHTWGAKAKKEKVEAMTAAKADEEEPVEEEKEKKVTEIIVSPPADGVRLQRGFTPFDPRKRLYSIAVGDSKGVHYAYDFKTATILRVWNGPFLDLIEFWEGRAHNQYLNAIGPSLTFHDNPTIALLESGKHDWPTESDAMWNFEGYTLDERGAPTFHARLSEIEIEDKITPTSSPRSLIRHLTLRGDHTSWMTGILLAEADSITPQADGLSYIVGDREFYIDVSADNKNQPFIRRINGRDQLLLYPPKYNGEATLSYTLVW
ncbi:MAG: hypothetical protein SynsKO_21240 [Synoicihabitans sp.]